MPKNIALEWPNVKIFEFGADSHQATEMLDRMQEDSDTRSPE